MRPSARRTARRTARRGFSLIELLVVLAIIAIVSGISLPKLRTFRGKSQMRSAKGQLVSSIIAARGAAVQKGLRSTFMVSQSVVKVDVQSDTSHAAASSATGTYSVLRNVDLRSRFSVTVTVPSNAADSVIIFDARGFGTTGSSTTAKYRLSGNGVTDSVCVSAYGLIMKNGCGA